ncbi:hypothetical protein ABZW30_19095 [Kitasatospora sp. NPDC004669]|uniref:hypothetical protein n=1 Tax=Kitasatospora sp. NPDC004669 TaxID=3154555 RepID=UPI0033BD96C4
MRVISRALGVAAAAGTMLLAAAIPASATPTQANYTGSGFGSTAAGAKQAALNDALAQARAAGFANTQCLQLGIAQAWPDSPFLASRTAKGAEPAVSGPVVGTTWEGTAQVQCASQPAPGTVNLNRYNGPEHLSTTGSAPGGYYLEGSLGWLYGSQVAGTAPLYTCHVWGSVDTFTSPDPNCEGQQFVSTLGFIYTSPPAGVASRVVRRCIVGSDHFDSNDINCEGQIAEGILGYSLD